MRIEKSEPTVGASSCRPELRWMLDSTMSVKSGPRLRTTTNVPTETNRRATIDETIIATKSHGIVTAHLRVPFPKRTLRDATATTHVVAIWTITTPSGAPVLLTASLLRRVIPIEHEAHDAAASTSCVEGI